MKHKKLKFIILSASYLVITVLDLLLTYFATPDLKYEGSPLVTELEFGWTGMLIANLVTYVVFLGMAVYSYLIYKSPISYETDIKRYLADITYGDPEKANLGMWKLPTYWAPQVACLCYSVSTALPFARLIIVVEWVLLLFKIDASVFFSIVAIFPMGRIDFFLALFLAWGFSFVWILREFKHNKLKVLRENL